MADEPSFWYRLGYSIEQRRGRFMARPAGRGTGVLRSLSERLSRTDSTPKVVPGDGSRPAEGGPGAGSSLADAAGALGAAGAGAAAVRLLSRWPAARKPGIGGLLRAGVAGAAAALSRRLVRAALEARRPALDEELGEALLSGAARGLIYGAVVEPRLPGPRILRGAVYGSIEYAVSPWGGLTELLGKAAPHRRLPLLDGLFEGFEPEEDTWGDHLSFALVLALLYGGPGGPPGRGAGVDAAD